MKTLKELIDAKDYSYFKKCTYSSFYNYYDTLSEELFGIHRSITEEMHDEVEKSGRVTKYAIREWLCTDTYVGFYLYLIDNTPVCFMYQSGRKDYPDWHFISEDTYVFTQEFFKSFMKMPKYKGMDEDFWHLYIDKKRFNCSIENEDLGISNLCLFDEYVKKMWIPEGLKPYLKEEIDKHMEIRKIIPDVERYDNSVNLEKLRELAK